MKYFIAFYISAWIISLAKLYYPSIKFLKAVGSESVLVRNEFLGWIVAVSAFGVGTLLLFPISLSNSASKQFIVAFCDRALEK
jgi:hypothetical protein